MGLFRNEVLENRKAGLHGEVQLTLPLSWQLVGGLMFAIAAAGLFFLVVASYSRIETVKGIITPEGGVAQIVPTRAGTISSLPISAGDEVKRGSPLAIIKTDENSASGMASSTQILQSLGAQENDLQSQERQIAASAAAERMQLQARISGLKLDLANIGDRIAVQQELVDSARQELELAQGIAERGFISQNDIRRRRETWLTRKQTLTQLEQSLANQQSAIHEATAAMQQSRASTGAQLAALASQRSEIAQRRTNAEVSGAYRLEAPLDGTVTALTARVGQSVSPQEPIMAMVPTSSELRAELYIPTAAIGFIEVGQDVALALDAFPYQRFGTVPARITSIATAPVRQTDSRGNLTPVFIVTAVLRDDRVNAHGKQRKLIAGMTLTALITTEEQSLLEWLFEPLFAIRGR